MSNVSNPSGPLNPLGPQRSTEPTKPGTDKFRDLMKIDSAAEKQKKRKKRSTEAEEEQKSEMRTNAKSAEQKAEPNQKPISYPKTGHVGEKVNSPSPSHKTPEDIATELAREEAAALSQEKNVRLFEDRKKDEQQSAEKEINAAESMRAQVEKEWVQSFEEQTEREQQEKEAQEFKKTTARKNEENQEEVKETLLFSSNIGNLFLSPASEIPPAYTLMDAQTLALFEKMISTITILKESGITETTLHLTSPEFANSRYFGAQVIIREYSTAPLTYNIEFLGNPLATELFRKNLPLLRSAFNDPKYRFKIHRLESHLTEEEHPRVERKEESDG